MNRVIKFRAFDSLTGKLINNNEPLLWNRIMPAISVQDGSEYQSYTVMQFTGLHDKNGVEIYEGDILRYSFTGDYSHSGTGAVSFENGCFNCNTFLFWDSGLGSNDWEFEVIGNIYQNPELLA